MLEDRARRRQRGVTLVEVALVVAIIGVMAVIAVPAMDGVFQDQRVKSAARSVADAFTLGRAEAIRSGNTHLVVFQNALGTGEQIAIVNDGTPDTADCTVNLAEIVHTVAPERDVSWGTSVSLANGTPGPDDLGSAPLEVDTGSSFTDASRNPANPASWILFQPDGMPRLFTGGGGACTAISQVGTGGGAIYVTNTRRDYAIVLSHLGTVRVHVWNQGAGAWRN